MAKLKGDQQAALDKVTAAHRHRVTVRQAAEAEARALVEERVATAARLESEAVRQAIAAGVPRTRIGREGLDTADYRTVARVLAVTDGAAEQAASIEQARAALHRTQVRRANPGELDVWATRLHPAGDVLLRIDWPGFEPADGGILAENAGGGAVDLVGWAHRAFPGDDLDWAVLDGGQLLDQALRYEDRVREAVLAAVRA